MSDTTPQPVSNGCRKYVKSKIKFNTFNTFNNVIKKGDERKERYKCKDCAMFADEDADSAPYCLAKDLYTFVMGEDEACEEFVKWNGKK